MMDREKVLLDIARIIWRRGITINEFYSTLGMDMDDFAHSDPTETVSELAGIITGWHNPPENDDGES